MATESSGGSNGFLYFVVGALVVGMVVLGFMFFNGGHVSTSPVDRAANAVSDAAHSVGDAAKKSGSGG